MTEETKILPCPFCESLMIITHEHALITGCFCFCVECGAKGPIKDREDFAVSAWNNVQRASVNQWQPIETAPKDGGLVLITSILKKVFIAYYDTEEKIWHRYHDGRTTTPTHWMALPDAPIEEDLE